RFGARLAGRLDLQYDSWVFVRQQVQQSVWPLPYITNTLVKFREDWLTLNGTALFEGNTPQMSCSARAAFEHRTHERIAFPVWKSVARVKRHTGNRDGRYPVHQRRLEVCA